MILYVCLQYLFSSNYNVPIYLYIYIIFVQHVPSFVQERWQQRFADASLSSLVSGFSHTPIYNANTSGNSNSTSTYNNTASEGGVFGDVTGTTGISSQFNYNEYYSNYHYGAHASAASRTMRRLEGTAK